MAVHGMEQSPTTGVSGCLRAVMTTASELSFGDADSVPWLYRSQNEGLSDQFFNANHSFFFFKSRKTVACYFLGLF